MKSPDEVLPPLAAQLYYMDPKHTKDVQYEQLEEEKQKPYVKRAGELLVAMDKLNLCVVEKSTKNEAEVEKLLHDKLEGTVREFFAGITVWKKGAIPQEELVARIWSVWKTL